MKSAPTRRPQSASKHRAKMLTTTKHKVRLTEKEKQRRLKQREQTFESQVAAVIEGTRKARCLTAQDLATRINAGELNIW